jgi:hypothetical protein
MQVDSVSMKLVLEYQLALAKLGYTSRYFYSEWDMKNSQDGYNRHPKHTVTTFKNRTRNGNGWIDDKNWYVPIKMVECDEMDGVVYNLETKDNTYQVPFLVHNCCSGGGVALAIAVREGLINCSQARRGILRGMLFKKTVEIAHEKGYIKRKNYRVEKIS